MTASQFTADRQAAAHTPWLADALDINDNGLLGWPDLMAWIFFGTVGVLVVAVVAGMALSGVALAAHGIRRMAYGVWGAARRSYLDTGQPAMASRAGGSDARGNRVDSATRSARHRAGASRPEDGRPPRRRRQEP